ncbi:MAG: GDSL-type esterase/lipase family protein [Clostridia bacterium]|nr:GDSL-type esterase/lipase family protein [Clostridia bacterium]
MNFLKKNGLLCLFVFLTVCVIILGILLFREIRPRPVEQPPKGSSEVHTTDAAATETEAVTEPPVPVFQPEDDIAYYPGEHEAEGGAQLLISSGYRFYGASPKTDSEGFNNYCYSCVSSLERQCRGDNTAREGGNTIVTVDYILYKAGPVYSCVLTSREQTDDTVSETVRVLIYDTEKASIYAPLDIYDLESGYADALAALMRTGYEAAFAEKALAPDAKFLDSTCTADPSSFVNIAMDDENMYFYKVFTDEGKQPHLLCSAVPFAALHEYETAYIEELRRQEELEKQLEEEFFPEPEEPIIPVDLPTYDLSGAVPESAMVDDSYFDDSLFIGNSLIVGLSMSVKINATYFASVGLNVKQFFDKETILMTDGSYRTMYDAIATAKFEKVYLMFGINELGWGSISSFINYYSQIIDRVREVNPNAIVYVQSILPINEEKWAKSRDYHSSVNNYSVAAFNQKIVDMCTEKSAYFVNVAECLMDETGNLNPEATSDGIHIGGVYSTRWLEYLKTHTISK